MALKPSIGASTRNAKERGERGDRVREERWTERRRRGRGGKEKQS